jgi:hypothetical protein
MGIGDGDAPSPASAEEKRLSETIPGNFCLSGILTCGGCSLSLVTLVILGMQSFLFDPGTPADLIIAIDYLFIGSTLLMIWFSGRAGERKLPPFQMTEDQQRIYRNQRFQALTLLIIAIGTGFGTGWNTWANSAYFNNPRESYELALVEVALLMTFFFDTMGLSVVMVRTLRTKKEWCDRALKLGRTNARERFINYDEPDEHDPTRRR